jgi:hypothetical protein
MPPTRVQKPNDDLEASGTPHNEKFQTKYGPCYAPYLGKEIVALIEACRDIHWIIHVQHDDGLLENNEQQVQPNPPAREIVDQMRARETLIMPTEAEYSECDAKGC